MGKTFRNIYASSIGNFEENTSKIPQWITANGGTYSKNITNEITHLIATREAFKQYVSAVDEAKKIGTVKIVSYDWLVDSLLSKGRMPLAAKPYLWGNILKEEKQKSQVKKSQAKESQTKEGQTGKGRPKKDQKEEEQTQKDPPKDMQPAGKLKQKLVAEKKRRKKRSVKSRDPFDDKPRTPRAQSIASLYDLYETGDVTYNATLTRLSSCQNTREKIYETIKSPHTYATHIKFSRLGLSGTEMLAPIGSSLDTAMSEFKEIFRSQAGKEWEDRMDGIAPPPREDEDGNVQPPWKGWFFYDTGPMSLSTVLQGRNT
ncbi:hypothetical protein BDW59DRAFT_160259 [Aspergillus cavernicola]|uniref:BRCT domain-containing protein n=1 Tax=Aspergillus cavernicola TaxID=176166 RepID=A0ABR4IL38_9EURO